MPITTPDEANRLLDSIGLDKRDAQGYRLRPDGKRLQVLIEIPEGGWGPWIDIAELVKDYWEAVGISTDFKVLERSYWFTRADAGITQVTFWTMDYQLTPLVNPDKLLPRETVGRLPTIGICGMTAVELGVSNQRVST